jgi:UDP-N-acetylmuramyl tripeptide synthase
MKEAKRPQIISVTGTKGKSTIVYILDAVLQKRVTTLRVDTAGYYINGEQKGTFADSTRLAGLVPTVAPGRFLTAMQGVNDFTAILECSLGSSNPPGLGYSHHGIGIFTNVYEDHIGNTERLKTPKNIAEAKRFIFKRLRPDGYAVFNADDKLVCSQLDALPSTAHKIPCGLTFDAFDIKKHLNNGGVCITIENDWLIIKSQEGTKKTVSLKQIPWTFNGTYEPSNWNLMLIVGALYAQYKGKIPKTVLADLQSSRLNPYGGRLTQLKSKQKVQIIADYAHEKFSLAAIGDLAKSQKLTPQNKIIGVVRLAYDRDDKLIKETAKYIAPHFDEFIVYDKIDGYLQKPKETLGKFKMVVGRISEVFANALQQEGTAVTRIIREDQAIAHAAKIAEPGDVVIVIVNDDLKRSIQFIKNEFKADFV